MVGFFHAGRQRKIRTEFYWVKLLMYTIFEYWNILPLDLVQKSFWLSSHFDTQTLDIVQKSLRISGHFDIFQIFFLSDFLGNKYPKIYI